MAAIAGQRATLIGVFEDRAHAESAIRELTDAGFGADQIGIAGRDAGAGVAPVPDSGTEQSSPATASGAVTGAVAGASLGGLVALGLSSGVIPVIGPVIAGGTLALVLANTAGGAAIGGVLGAATGETLRTEESEYYEREFEAGRTIVTVKAGSRHDEALQILHRNGGYDLDRESTRPAVTTATAATIGRSTTAAGTSAEPFPGTSGEAVAERHRIRLGDPH